MTWRAGDLASSVAPILRGMVSYHVTSSVRPTWRAIASYDVASSVLPTLPCGNPEGQRGGKRVGATGGT